MEKNNDEDDNQDYAYDENYDYDGEYDDEDGLNDENMDGVIEVTPKFTIDGRTITVDKGTTISLPCSVDKLPRKFLFFSSRIQCRKMILSALRIMYKVACIALRGKIALIVLTLTFRPKFYDAGDCFFCIRSFCAKMSQLFILRGQKKCSLLPDSVRSRLQ